MAKITINYDKCEGEECAECVYVCSMEILKIDNGKIIIQNPEECSLCEVCMDVCPNGVIKVEDD